MYNQNLKAQYIESLNTEALKKTYTQLFNKISSYENKHNKDIYEFDLETLIITVSGLGVKNSSVNSNINRIKRYVNWCKEIGLLINDAVFNIDLKNIDSDKFKDSYFANAKHLQTVLDSVLDNEEQKTANCLIRVACWLAFSGIHKEEINFVEKNNIDIETKMIHYNNEEYELYEQSIPSIQVCINERFFVYNHPNYQTLRERKSDKLLSGLRADGVSEGLIRKEFCQRLNGDRRITLDNIWLSGQFFRLMQNELRGETLNFEKIVRCCTNKDLNNVSDNYIKSRISFLKKDYSKWKKTFYSDIIE